MKKAIKILTIVGARPQFIKAAVVSRAISRHNGDQPEIVVQEEICHTGQHYDHGMSQVFFDEMGIPNPLINLEVGSGLHGEATAQMLIGLEREILNREPDVVLVYGDTNSTLAGALAAAKLRVPLAHVEAGLRSFNRSMPEEINRVLTDHLAQLLFCPSENAREQLNREGIEKGIHVTGDVMYDAFLHYSKRAEAAPLKTPFVLATIHRPSNTDDLSRLRIIMSTFDNLPVRVVLPVHPRTRKSLRQLAFKPTRNLMFIEPLSYFQMLGYLQKCLFVITDSGGLQKEAFFAGRKCVTLRNETEWVELVEQGVNRLTAINETQIKAAFDWAIDQDTSFPEKTLYGDGHSGERIVRVLFEALNHKGL